MFGTTPQLSVLHDDQILHKNWEILHEILSFDSQENI